MKLNVIALALAATAFGAISAQAEEIVVKERVPGVVVKERIHHPSVVVRERATVGSGSVDCTSKTVHREGLNGSKTVKKTRCD